MILDANIFHSLARMLRGYPGRKRGGILNSLGRETIVRFQRGCPGVRGGIFWLIIFLFTRILRDVEWEEEYFELLRIRKTLNKALDKKYQNIVRTRDQQKITLLDLKLNILSQMKLFALWTQIQNSLENKPNGHRKCMEKVWYRTLDMENQNIVRARDQQKNTLLDLVLNVLSQTTQMKLCALWI